MASIDSLQDRNPLPQRLCHNTPNLSDVMLSKAKHLAFSGLQSRDSSAEFILSVEGPQNDITTESLREREG